MSKNCHKMKNEIKHNFDWLVPGQITKSYSHYFFFYFEDDGSYRVSQLVRIFITNTTEPFAFRVGTYAIHKYSHFEVICRCFMFDECMIDTHKAYYKLTVIALIYVCIIALLLYDAYTQPRI